MTEIAWKRICCPVDFSDESRNALTVAADLARRFGAELTLLHVDDRPATAVAGQLAAWRQEAEEAGASRVVTAHTPGHPKSAIARWTNDNGFDLVVMGTHGRTGRAHALVGSVAENTVRSARCPVMVIHGEWTGVAR
jgi:universal stress protein A